MVDIYVGRDDQKKHIHVHKGLLCSKVPYFEKMFFGGFKEATENSAEFPDDDVQAFDILIQWVYSGIVPPFKWIPDPDAGEGCWESSWSLLKTYLLMDKFCLFTVGDQLLTNFLIELARQHIVSDFDMIDDIYEQAPEDSPLRKFALYSFYHTMNVLSKNDTAKSAWKMEEVKGGLMKNGDLLLDYLKLSQQHDIRDPIEAPTHMPICTFHRHTDDEPCTI
jgi:hypothetical protein